MNHMKRFLARMYQLFIRIPTAFVPFRKPKLFFGEGCSKELPRILHLIGIKTVLLVTGPFLMKSGAPKEVISLLDASGIRVVVFDRTGSDPTIENVEMAVEEYQKQKCEALVAFGGGSPIDLAKAVSARIGHPAKSLLELRGLLKLVHPIPPVFAIPTTAGTGSEGTFCSVITNAAEKQKFFLLDPKLTPKVAFLDPANTVSMPREITVATGFDALTHAVEAFIGRSNTRKSSSLGAESVALIFQNLKKTVENPGDLEARASMQLAAYKAGAAFSIAYLGYVHAITHTLGGLYHVSHGYANAVLLPSVLEFYGHSAHKRLAKLSEAAGTCDPNDSQSEKAQRFISAVRTLAEDLGIPPKFTNVIREDELELIMDRAFSESYPSAPVPRFMSRDEMRALLQNVMN